MPLVQIHMVSGRTENQKKQLLHAITDAIRDSIDAPIDSIRVWINEIGPTEFMTAGVLMADKRAARAAEGA